MTVGTGTLNQFTNGIFSILYDAISIFTCTITVRTYSHHASAALPIDGTSLAHRRSDVGWWLSSTSADLGPARGREPPLVGTRNHKCRGNSNGKPNFPDASDTFPPQTPVHFPIASLLVVHLSRLIANAPAPSRLQLALCATNSLSSVTMSQSYTMAEVQKHKSDDSMWLVVENNVYDITSTSRHCATGIA